MKRTWEILDFFFFGFLKILTAVKEEAGVRFYCHPINKYDYYDLISIAKSYKDAYLTCTNNGCVSLSSVKG